MKQSYTLAFFLVWMSWVAPLLTGHAAQLQGRTASPPGNSEQGRPISLPLKLCFWLILPLTHPAPDYTLPPTPKAGCVSVSVKGSEGRISNSARILQEKRK